MATRTFGVKIGTLGPTGIPNSHHGSGVDVTISYDDTKVTTRKALKWAVDEVHKMIEGSNALTP